MLRHTTVSIAIALAILGISCPAASALPRGGDAGVDQSAPPSATEALPAVDGGTELPGTSADGAVPERPPSISTPPESPESPESLPPPAPPPAAAESQSADIEPGADRRTGIRGRIGDRKSGQPLAEAPVMARGADGNVRTVLTDAKGAFQLFLPPGTYTVRSHYGLHHGARMEHVPVVRGAFAKVNLVLDPIDLDEEVIVQEIEIPYRADTTTVAAQDQLRKESRGIGEGMGAQQMSQQGASDAGSAAKRVVGVTIDDNQLVVRGLGGRYVKVVLNGLPVPNTDPDFPSVDLDLFPTNVIDSLNIQKVFLPDIPGDFAGGVLDLNTVSFPRKFLISAGLSTGYNSQTTFRDRLAYRGGGTDWLGFDDGTRAIPGVVAAKKLVRSTGGPFPDPQSVEAAGEQFQNRWNIHRTTGLPQMGFNFAVGDSIKLAKQRRFGYLATLVYDYNVERQVGVSRPRPGTTATGDAVETNRYDLESGSTSVQMTAIGTASLDLGSDHSLTALTMFNRSMDDQTRYRNGINAEVSTTIPYEKWQFRFLGRTVFLNQLLGDHRNLGGTRARVRWSAYYGIGRRDEPDQRTVAYGESGGLAHRWKPTADRLWSDLGQVDFGGTSQLRFPLWPEAWGTVGGRAGFSDRAFSNRRFQMQESFSASDPNAFTADPETLFGAEGLGPLSRIIETTQGKDSYTSSQKSYAGFLLVETPVLGPLSAAGGARLEVFSQQVESKSPFPEDNTPETLAKNRTDRTDMNVLPGGALKYALSSTMLLRAAYGMTLSRPQVRELAPYDYYDFLRDRIIIGEPNLRSAKIHNGDLRWEWFFGEGQILAISGFYKKFIDPIELQIIGEKLDSKYQNALGATNMGGEFELRSTLNTLSRALRWFEVGGNLSLIRSQIQVSDAGATRSNRRLAGQAPYVVNLSLRFLDPETKLSLGLVYNVVGPRITDVGIRLGDAILPNIEEQPFHSLDFVGSWGIGKHLKLKLKARNLLARSKVLKQGSLIAQQLYPGVTVSLGLSFDY